MSLILPQIMAKSRSIRSKFKHHISERRSDIAMCPLTRMIGLCMGKSFYAFNFAIRSVYAMIMFCKCRTEAVPDHSSDNASVTDSESDAI